MLFESMTIQRDHGHFCLISQRCNDFIQVKYDRMEIYKYHAQSFINDQLHQEKT